MSLSIYWNSLEKLKLEWSVYKTVRYKKPLYAIMNIDKL